MDCESNDQTISLWIRHLTTAVTTILPAEKRLCTTVLSTAVGPECFAVISSRIMLLLLRFGEKFALSPTAPHKLINLLKMSDTVRRLRPSLFALFDDCAPKLSARSLDLEKFLVSATFSAFSALPSNLQPHADVSVPSVVLHGVNFLTSVAADRHAPPSPRAFTDALDALQRVVEAVWEKFRDRVAAHVFAMNANWHIYVKTRGSVLASIVGEEEMMRRYKLPAEAAAYAYQDEAWGPMARMLETAEVAGFTTGMKDSLRRHRRGCGIEDEDLRGQMKEKVEKMMVSAYEAMLRAHCGAAEGSGFVMMEDVRAMVGWMFDDGGGRERRRRDKAVPEGIMALLGREREKGRRRRWRRRRIVRLQFDNEGETRSLSLSSNGKKLVSHVENLSVKHVTDYSCSFF